MVCAHRRHPHRGIVDQHIQAAVALYRLFDHAQGIGLDRDVAGDGDRIAGSPQLVDQTGQAGPILGAGSSALRIVELIGNARGFDIGNGEREPGRRQAACDRRAQSILLGATRDERYARLGTHLRRSPRAGTARGSSRFE